MARRRRTAAGSSPESVPSANELSADTLHLPLHGHLHGDVACETADPSETKHPGASLDEVGHHREKTLALLDGRGATHLRICVPRDDADHVLFRPRLDGGALRLLGELLLTRRPPEDGDCELGIEAKARRLEDRTGVRLSTPFSVRNRALNENT